MSKSKISWTQETWNPVTGCTKISPGCLHCYAEVMAKRLQAMGQPKYKDGFKVTCHPDVLNAPSKVRKPTLFFVCSMGDLFHEDVPDEFIFDVLDRCYVENWHTYQILTKRPERMRAMINKWAGHLWGHVWWGTTIEDQKRYDERAPILRELGSGNLNTFISFEPLLGPIDITSGPPDWVIVGGESGPGYRPMREAWATDIMSECFEAEVPAFFKQWSGVNKKAAGHLIDMGYGLEVIQQVPPALERFFNEKGSQ